MDTKSLKNKLIIGSAVIILLLAVVMIARDLFRQSPSYTFTPLNNAEELSLKDIDTTLVGYEKIRVFETTLNNATGIAVNDDNIYICGDGKVIVFNLNGDKTEKFTIDSAANCIAVSGKAIYLAINSKIVRYSLNGTEKDAWKPYLSNGYITSIASDNDFVYAADAINKRVLKYTTEGKFIQEISPKDSLNNSKDFIVPSRYFDLEIGAFNDVWIVNPGMQKIENYSNAGILRTSWGQASYEKEGFSGCCNPAHMTLMPDGSFITYEKGVDKIKAFDPTGQFVCFVAGAGYFKGDSDFQLGHTNLIKDMATDKGGLIYLLDAYNRICVFKKKNG